MSIETISYEVRCVPSATFGWAFFHSMSLGGPHSHCARWSRMADRKAAAREIWATMREVDGVREVFSIEDGELAGLGLFLALLALVPS